MCRIATNKNASIALASCGPGCVLAGHPNRILQAQFYTLNPIRQSRQTLPDPARDAKVMGESVAAPKKADLRTLSQGAL